MTPNQIDLLGEAILLLGLLHAAKLGGCLHKIIIQFVLKTVLVIAETTVLPPIPYRIFVVRRLLEFGSGSEPGSGRFRLAVERYPKFCRLAQLHELTPRSDNNRRGARSYSAETQEEEEEDQSFGPLPLTTVARVRLPVASGQSLPGISHSSLLDKRHHNNPKTNPNPNPNPP